MICLFPRSVCFSLFGHVSCLPLCLPLPSPDCSLSTPVPPLIAQICFTCCLPLYSACVCLSLCQLWDRHCGVFSVVLDFCLPAVDCLVLFTRWMFWTCSPEPAYLSEPAEFCLSDIVFWNHPAPVLFLLVMSNCSCLVTSAISPILLFTTLPLTFYYITLSWLVIENSIQQHLK